VRFLCVDDNLTLRKMIDLMLATTGADVDFAENGREAVEAYQTKEYDAVVMDMEMPVMSGLQAAREIRQIEDGYHLTHTPILFLTGNEDLAHVEKGVEAGGDGHLTKPFTSDALIAALDQILRCSHRSGVQNILRSAQQ